MTIPGGLLLVWNLIGTTLALKQDKFAIWKK